MKTSRPAFFSGRTHGLRLTAAALSAAGLLATTAALPARAQSAKGFLKADGIYIRDDGGKGDTVWLYGVNFGGLFVHEPWMSPLAGANTEWDSRTTLETRFGKMQAQKLLDTYWDSWAAAADFKNIAADGMNCVRMPIYFLDYMDDNGNWRKDGAGAIDFSRIDKLVRAAADNGVFTVIDLHGAPGSQNNNQHSGKTTGANLYTTPRYQEMLVTFWTEMARHFKDNTAVAGYDLLNEPSSTFPGAMGQNVVDLYDRCYKAIRAVDDNHIIFMEAIWAWNLLPDPAAKGWANVSYSLHYYKWEQNGDLNVMKTFIDGKVKDANTWQAKYKVPHFAGEFTWFTNPQSWEYGMGAAVQGNWHWTFWSYKVKDAGSSWGLYTAKDGAPNIPDVTKDSYDQILRKWGSWDTPTYFTRNPMVADAVKKAANLRKAIHPTALPERKTGNEFTARRAGNALKFSFPEMGIWQVTLRNVRGETVRSVKAEGTVAGVGVEGVDPGVYVATVRGARSNSPAGKAAQIYSCRVIVAR